MVIPRETQYIRPSISRKNLHIHPYFVKLSNNIPQNRRDLILIANIQLRSQIAFTPSFGVTTTTKILSKAKLRKL